MFNRPEKRNALTLTMIQQMTTYIDEVAGDPGIRAIILSGSGGVFSAGVDVSQFATMEVSTAPDFIQHLHKLCATVRQCAKPVIAAIDGPCIGGSFELALSCDLRVATPGATMGLPEVQLGLPSVIEAALLLHHVGLSKTQELVLTGEPITATEAERMGLVARIVPAGQLEQAAVNEAKRLLKAEPAAFALQKQLINSWLNEPLDRAVQNSFWAFATSFDKGTPQRLAQDFLDRRKKKK